MPSAHPERGQRRKAQRRGLAPSLSEYRETYPNRDEAMAQAYLSGNYTMKEIGEFFGVHYMTVSRAVQKTEAAGKISRSRGKRPAGSRRKRLLMQ